MRSLEMSGKTVEEAIQSALEQLGVSREEVKVTVLKEGRHGILGLGAEESMVRVEPLVPTLKERDDMAEKAREVLETLLTMMGVTASVEEEEGATVPIAFNIEGDDLGILIGRRGQTLACLQYLVRLIVAYQVKTWVPIIIDVEGYKQRRYETLQALAWRMAEQVKAKGVSFTLEPMPAYERRIIHMALADHPDVITQSTGVDEVRRVIILLREG
ncbi:MAG: protein jag [Dehalococcoidia bacterium]|nr:MAG: protein jag [Dehalococcoidia bacterium]